jgi:hypothetical protein
MLTQEQKDLLEPLTHHQKFGKLLQEAIKGWEEVNPKKNQYGLNHKFNKFELLIREDDSESIGCCLLGSAMLFKYSDGSSVFSSVLQLFSKLNENSVSELMIGFDGDDMNNETEAYKFGKQINKILFS